MIDPRYPLGPFEPPTEISDDRIARWIDDIEMLPARLRETVRGMSPEQLEQPYRPGGWTARQVVHHIADSHINSVVRFKWALTESRPTIKAYDEQAWAELADYDAPVELSLDLIDALHARWVRLLRGLSGASWDRVFVHPDSGPTPLRLNVGIYAWHGQHHLAHIQLAQRSA